MSAELLGFSPINYLTAKAAVQRFDVVLLTYKEGHRIAKGEDRFHAIIASGETQDLTIAEIEVRDLAEAHAIEAALDEAA